MNSGEKDVLPELDDKSFRSHIKDEHGGYIPPLSQLNQPPWEAWVYYYDDDVELLYCRSKEDLT